MALTARSRGDALDYRSGAFFHGLNIIHNFGPLRLLQCLQQGMDTTRFPGPHYKGPFWEAGMKGYQLEFFTQQDVFHGGQHLFDWLIERARAQGIKSATVFMGLTGLQLQAAHMFDLIDHPVQVTMIVNEAECERLFALLTKENLRLFFVKLPVEYGRVGE